MAEYAQRQAPTAKPALRRPGAETAVLSNATESIHQAPQLQRSVAADPVVAVHPKAVMRPWQAKMHVDSASSPAEAEADCAAHEIVHQKSNVQARFSSTGVQHSPWVNRLSRKIQRQPFGYPGPRNAAPKGLSGADAQPAPDMLVQAKCDHCEKEDVGSMKIQRVAKEEEAQAKCLHCDEETQRVEDGGPGTPAIASPVNHLEGFIASEESANRVEQRKQLGEPLPEPLKGTMESGFGADFSGVRIHKDQESAALNQDLKAKAFTTGAHIFFGQGQFDPLGKDGQELVAHELAHTVQQGVVGPKKVEPVVSEVAKTTQEDFSAGLEAKATSEKAEKEKVLADAQKSEQEVNISPPVVVSAASEVVSTLTPPTLPVAVSVPVESNVPTLALPKEEVPAEQKPQALPSSQKQGPPDLKALKAMNPLDAQGGFKAAKIEQPTLDTSSGTSVLQSIAALPPTQQNLAMKQAGKALNKAQAGERKSVEKNLPEIDQPTGLGRNDFKKQKSEKGKSAGPVALKHGGRGKGKKLDTHVPSPKTPTPGSKIPKVQTKDVPDAHALGNMIAGLPTRDPALSTSYGPRPPVDLSGDADPNQNAALQSQADGQMNSAHALAHQEVQKDFGENDMYPSVRPKRLKAKHAMGPPPAFESSKVGPLPLLSSEMVNAWDPELQKIHQSEFDGGAQKALDGQAEYDAKSQLAYQENMGKIEEETEKTRQAQKDVQDKGRSEVAQHRNKWQAENEAVRAQYEKDSGRERAKVNQDIDAKVNEANLKVEEECKAAEQKAETATKESYEEADKTKRDADEKRKNRSWWEKVGDAVGDFFNMLKDAICKIFDKLREAVKGFIEFAKKAVSFIIDMARDLVVGLIKAFAEVLKGFVRIALAAFPTLRDKFIGYIDTAVEKTIKAIDYLAEGLKSIANMFLDFIGSVWNALLDVAQGLVMLQVMFYEMIITGNTELLDGIANLYNSATSMTGEMFWDAVFFEMTGQDAAEPLEDIEWKNEAEKEAGLAARIEEISQQNGAAGMPSEAAGGVQEGMEEPVSGIEMDSVPQEDLDPELLAQVAQLADGEEKEIAGASNPVTMKELAGGQPEEGQAIGGTEPGENLEDAGGGTAKVEGITAEGGKNPFEQTDQEKLDDMIAKMQPNCNDKAEGGGDSGPLPAEAKVGPLPTSVRRQHIMNQLTTGLSNWWTCNWPTVVAILAGVLVVGVVLTIVTAGGFLAILPVIMEALAAIFMAAMLVKMEGHIKDFLTQAWKGGSGIMDGAKSLARGLAVGAVELIFNVIFKVGGSIFAAIKAIIKAVIKGLKYLIKGAVRLIKGAVKAVVRMVLKSGKVAGGYLVKKGKYVFQGMQKGFSRGAKSLKDLGNRVLKFIKFKRIVIEKRGEWFRLLGEVNPMVPITPWLSIDLSPSGRLNQSHEYFGFATGVENILKIGKKIKGNVLKLTQKDWDHIIKSHVRSTFDASERVGKNVTTIFEGTPSEYMEYMVRAIENPRVVREIQQALNQGLTGFNIENIVVRGQAFTLSVDLVNLSINTFHATGRLSQKFTKILH